MTFSKCQIHFQNDRKIEERFRKRKERLEEYCRSKEIKDFRSWQTRNRHFYVGDAEHKLLGCVPLKAGCTSWIYWQEQLFTKLQFFSNSRHSNSRQFTDYEIRKNGVMQMTQIPGNFLLKKVNMRQQKTRVAQGDAYYVYLLNISSII